MSEKSGLDHLDPFYQVQDQLTALAADKGIEPFALVNELLRKDFKLIEAAR